MEIQAGLFRNQETYGFLEPQEFRAFTEYWIPIRSLGGVARANPDAVLNLTRQTADGGVIALEAILNVTQELPNASVSILDGTRTVASAFESLSPRATFHRTFPGLRANATYTVELRNTASQILLRHTEGKYDFVSHDQVQTGKQPSHEFPAEGNRSADDFLALGSDQESNGELVIALGTYQRGLTHFPDSIALNRAAGRLEVILRQYGAAVPHLSKALAWVSSDHEGAYYQGLALEAKGDDRGARIQWEFAQQSGSYHAPAMMSLAALAARGGDRAGALAMVQEVVSNQPRLTRAGGMEIALLRALRRTADAKQRLLFWRRQDPASSFLAYEAMRLGDNDPDLLAHLAADPDRIVEIASDYMRLGLYDDALDALGRQYPSGSNVVSEPGTARPDSYPLIAYYRGFCRFALGQDGRADFDAASRMPLTYVFPNRADSFAVLRRAIETNPHDASAHFLLGSLYLSGGETVPALREWQKANEINPSIPTLHRNMGYAVLLSGDSPRRAIELFREGIKYDPHNVDLYLGLEQAMEKADLPVSDRIGALQSFPEMQSAPAVLIFRLVRLTGEAGEFDPAEKLLENRFFPREEGGTNVREVYIQLKLNQARSAASQKRCASALEILQHLTDTVATLPFTTKGLEQFANSNSAEQAIQAIRSMCR